MTSSSSVWHSQSPTSVANRSKPLLDMPGAGAEGTLEDGTGEHASMRTYAEHSRLPRRNPRMLVEIGPPVIVERGILFVGTRRS